MIRNDIPIRPLISALACYAALTVPTTAQEPKQTDQEKTPAVEGQIFDHNGAGVDDVQVSLWPTEPADHAEPIATVRTNQYGDFQIFHHPPLSGPHLVVFNKEGYTEVRRRFEIVPGQLPPFIDLSLPGGLTLTGAVFDKLTATPVSGADVRATVTGRNWNVTTDQQGAFRIQQMIPGQGLLTVTADGFARATTRFTDARQPQQLRVELSPERIVELTIVDSDGTPVAGVTIECLEQALGDYRSLVSDQTGTAVLRGMDLESTHLAIRLTHPDYASDADFDRNIELPLDHARSHHRLTLTGAGRVVGKVTDAQTGRPLQGARVTVGRNPHSGLSRDWTGFDGTYTASGAHPGDTIASVYLNGYAPQIKPVTVRRNQDSTANFAMTISKQADGLVVDQTGQPIPGAYVYATSWRGYSLLGAQTLTDHDGRFILFNIPDDQFEVTVEAAGYQPLTGQLITPGQTHRRFELAPRPEPPGMTTKLKTGEPFPDLEMVTLQGAPLKMSDLRGRTVFIDFWAMWCAPCLIEIPHIVAVQEAFGSRKDFRIISISLDADQDEKKLRKFIKEKKMNWTHVFGKKGRTEQAATACGADYIPQSFLIGPDGTLKATNLAGPSMKDSIAAFLNAEPQQPNP